MKEYTCIVCPVGCTIIYSDDGTIAGNNCKRGKDYVISEVTNPVRTVTSTVSTDCGERCPVRTSKPISKDKIFEVMAVVNATKANTPIKVGDIIVNRIAGTEADLIATSKVFDINPPKEKK